jgi:hypothetical protein
MGQRRKKYGWLYHPEEGAWMPPNGTYAAERLGSKWVLWKAKSPYNLEGAVLVAEDCGTLENAVSLADADS